MIYFGVLITKVYIDIHALICTAPMIKGHLAENECNYLAAGSFVPVLSSVLKD
jgi:hypothetical protein